MAEKNIEINIKTESGYDILYPKTIANNITDFNNDTNLILKNNTKALFGLGTDEVPDDVLAWLGKYNQYWWRRKLIPTEESWYETRESVSDHEISYAGTPSRENTVYYSNSINISQTDGTISLSDPNSLTFSYDDYSNIVPAIQGKYIYAGTDLTIVFVPQTAEVYNTTSGGGFRVKIRQCYKIVSVYGVPPTEMPWQYVQSSDRNAYPDSGTQDGYEYEYLGIPFDNAVGAPKIETGSYMGTGTYGADNPIEIKVSFPPKRIFLLTLPFESGRYGINTTITYADFSMTEITLEKYASSASVSGKISLILEWGKDFVKWYVSDTSYYGTMQQYNNANTEYYYYIEG